MLIKKLDLEAIESAQHKHPHSILGMHPLREGGVVVRAFLQNAMSCEVIDFTSAPEKRYPMQRLSENGLFEVVIADKNSVFPYRLRLEQYNGEIRQCYDPYSFLPTLSDEDLHLFNEGKHHRAYSKLGSRICEINGVSGVAFAVWAPSARRVSLVGDFNQWDGHYLPMRLMGSSGIWELFVPGLERGMKYKYEIWGAHEELLLKSDPYAIYFEGAPNNASIIWDIEDFDWKDFGWLDHRSRTNWRQEPMSIYEMHLGSWKRKADDGDRPLTYRELAHELIDYLKEMGYTHVELMPVAEHPFSGSWGYQVTGFFAPTHRFGTPQDFMYFVDQLHRHGIGVIVDWVPAHFPKDAFALARFDGTALYEHADPRQGEHQDWGTLIFNYDRHEVRNFLIGSALSWFDRFHIDGIRVDAVASMLYLDYSRTDGNWVPNQYGGRENIGAIDFLRSTNDLIHHYYPGAVTIAEESTAFGRVSHPTSDYGLGFDFKWNMGWMHDVLEFFKKDPVHRKHHHSQLTFGMLYQYSEHFISVFSHDEVVHGKGSMMMKMGSWHMSEKAATLRALYTYMWMWPGKNTLFMGSDFGQSIEWCYDRCLEWHLLQYMDHEGIRRAVRDLNHLYREHRSIAANDYNPDGFQWINSDDWEHSIISFLRIGKHSGETLFIVGNFTPVQRDNYRFGLPHHGTWKEIFNSNASEYGGSNIGNKGAIATEALSWNGRPYSATLTLPPLSTAIFKFEP
ncbi:MAG: 1,4-alpha-glucan branching enzyme [Verrucomicrobia bacterium GWF2_51_19]|nr:MAG: 1,4-alpha-glucan branching enzyme [Verrucomicrobia bacterium GWF2_51_19]